MHIWIEKDRDRKRDREREMETEKEGASEEVYMLCLVTIPTLVTQLSTHRPGTMNSLLGR